MAKEPDYNPQVGDVVMADGQNVIFQVVEAPDSVGSTKVQPFHIGTSDALREHRKHSTPRTTSFRRGR